MVYQADLLDAAVADLDRPAIRGLTPGPIPSNSANAQSGLELHQFVTLVGAELAARVETLARVGLTAVLLDDGGGLLGRWEGDGRLEPRLIGQAWVSEAGATKPTWVTRSHAIHVVLGLGAPTRFHGEGNLNECHFDTQSVAVPILHPTTQRLLGILALEGPGVRAGDLLLPWLMEIGFAVQSRLCGTFLTGVKLLVHSYVSARRDARRPVICLDRDTLLCNAPAARQIGSSDHRVLWDLASRFLNDEAETNVALALGSGAMCTARFEKISGTEGAVGVKITFPISRDRPRRVRDRNESLMRSSAELPGRSPRWMQFMSDLAAARDKQGPVVLTGDKGVGKLHVAKAFGVAGVPILEAWCEADPVREIQAALRSSPVILAHVDRLERSAWDALLAGLEIVSDRRVILTLCDSNSAARARVERLSSIAEVVRVPSLRDRLLDIPHLIEALAADKAPPGQAPVRWMPDAVQLLSRVSWPENVRSLESVVSFAVERNLTGYVDARELPFYIRSQSVARRRTRLEELEAAEILDALREVRGNKFKAAQRLGIARSTLHRRIRSLGLNLDLEGNAT